MARILIGTAAIIGHVNPFVPLARALAARGHAVQWTTSATFREPIVATRVRFVTSEHARDFKELRREDFVVGGESCKASPPSKSISSTASSITRPASCAICKRSRATSNPT